MRRPSLALLLVLLAGLLVGCGLPLPEGARSAGAVPDATPRGGPVVVLPPGPAPGASPSAVVTGFLAAQVSSAGDYAVARQFLAEGVVWDPDALVEVYDPARPVDVEADGERVVVTASRTAQVREDGSYRRVGGELRDAYGVTCTGTDGAPTCRISALPAGYGLRLSTADLAGSFAPRSVHFLAPRPDGTDPDSLVPDLVWLPSGEGLARRLVRQLVEEGPSDALEGSVLSAVPAETVVRDVEVAPDGTVRVDLSEQVRTLDDAGRTRLSAQLVWTLRQLGGAFTGLRLTSAGEPLEVDGEPDTQPASAWADFSPEPLGPRVASYYLGDGVLRAVDGGLARSAATDGTLDVQAAAVSPDGTLALLAGQPDGTRSLLVGPQSGPFGEPLTTGRSLSSPTWGAGHQGVWLVRDGGLVRVPPGGEPVAVPVEGRARYGPVRAVRLSRDGVRIALLAGPRDQPPALLVGRLVQVGGVTTVDGLREIRPDLLDVADVTWESATTLVVVTRFTGFGRLPARLAIDGSGPVVRSPLLLPEGAELLTVGAAPERPLVAGATVQQQEQVLREEGQVLAVVEPGRAPFYPG